MKLWRAVRFFQGHSHNKPIPYTKSPWFFPSPFNPMETVGKQSLAHALRKKTAQWIEKELLPQGSRRHSHGCRAFYVLVRRSEFIADGQIAAEIGDASGAPIIIKHYGPLPPNWRDSKEGKVTWLPNNGIPAWADLLNRLKSEGAEKILAL